MKIILYTTIFFEVIHLRTGDALDLPSLMIEEGLVPDVLKKPPDEPCHIFYDATNLRVYPGDVVNSTLIQEAPIVTWNVSNVDLLYTLIVVGMSQYNETELLSKPNRHNVTSPVIRTWLQWVVGNIRANYVNGGNALYEYKTPRKTKHHSFYRYTFLIYKQKQKLELDSWIFQHKYGIHEEMPVDEFSKACGIGNPVAGSFLVYKEPVL